MSVTAHTPLRPAPGKAARRERRLAWARLLLGIALCALFLAASSWVGSRLPVLRAFARQVEAYDLRPSAIYYTDYEASGEAEQLIRSSLEYAPGQHQHRHRAASSMTNRDPEPGVQ